MRFLPLSLILLVMSFPLKSQETAGPGEGDLKCAWVDIQSLFADYHKTQAARREINLERARIQKRSQEAIQQLRERREELMELQASISSGKLTEDEQEKKRLLIPVLIREMQQMDLAREKVLKAENTRLNDQMLKRMKAILKELVILIQDRAESAGYDLVMDSSGENTSQVVPVLYMKDATDITPIIRKELAKLAANQEDSE